METSNDTLLAELETGATVLTVNSRLARFLRRAFDLRQHRAGRLAWTAPDIISFDAWLRRCWNDAFDLRALTAPPPADDQSSRAGARRAGRRPVPVAVSATDDLFGSSATLSPDEPPLPALLSASHEQVIWEGIIAESRHGHALLQIGATARSVRQAWGLLRQWRLSPDDLVAPLPDDAYAFREWAEDFRELCQERHWADEASLPDFVAGFFRDETLPPSDRLLCVGFDEPSPQLRELFEAAGCESVEPPVAPEPRVAVRTSFADAASELEAAARWARAILERGGEAERAGPDAAAGPVVAVVIPDLAERRAVVERVFADFLHPAAVLPPSGASPQSPLYNISLGHSLAQVPLIRAALLVLELAGGEEGAVEAVGSALRSPFLSGFAEEQTCRAAVDAAIRRNGHLTTSLRAVYRACRRVGAARCPRLRRGLAALRRRLAAPGVDFRSPAAWAREFAETLRELGWPHGRTLDSAEYQALRRWHGLLEQLASLESVLAAGGREHSAAIPRGAALARLRQFAAEAVFQPQGPSDAPVQILGLLEASAGMTFDHLWVAGLYDEAWPGPSHPNPFLPIEFQRRHGMPHASPEWELEFAERSTRRLLVSAPDVIVSYPERNGDQDLRPSPLIADLPELGYDGEAADHSVDLPQSAIPLLCDHLFAARASETVADVPCVAVSEDERSRLRGGTRIFTDQAACPFRAFARHRLGARGLEACAAGPAPVDRGVMVHRALERLWGSVGSWDVLSGSTEAQLAALAESAARAAVREAFRDPRSRLARLEVDRLRRLLLDWLWIERGRAPFTVVRRESRRTVSFGGLTVETIIDRVDRLADGSLVIIDYKTSQPKVRDWFGERPTEPQLPIYCASCDGSERDEDGVEDTASSVAAVAFAQIRAGDMRFLGVARTEARLLPGVEHYGEREEAAGFATWEDLVTAWSAELHALGDGFLTGQIRVAPKAGRLTCSRCDLGSLCRVHELISERADDAESEEI